MSIYYTFSCRIAFITVYTSTRVAVMAALSSLAALWVVTLTPLGAVGDGGVVVTGAVHFGASFPWCIEKGSYCITSNCVTELKIFIYVYAYVYVLYVISHRHVLLYTL